MVTHDQREAMTMSDLVVVMNAGRIEQIGEPLEVYRRPATSFVARFIGTTNLLPATRGSDDGILRVSGREFAVSGDATSGDVVISVRPEDAHLSIGDPPERNALPGTVVFVRDLGEMFECYVDCGLEDNVVVAGSPRERVQVRQGERVAVTFPPEACIVVGGEERA
jgi:putative spermidine/putrescine transport system ATP-binding protein